jgi:hypothetical protein
MAGEGWKKETFLGLQMDLAGDKQERCWVKE